MDGRFVRAALVGVLIATVLGWSSLLGSAIGWMTLAATVVSALLAWGLWTLMHKGGEAAAELRERLGATDAGSHHAFNGVRLRVEDDGRHVWIDGPGVQRVMQRHEPDEAQAARHTGAWRRDAKGVLMLRVDAVVQNLATMPGRDDPRIQKFRRYLERDVLFPAQQRRRAA